MRMRHGFLAASMRTLTTALVAPFLLVTNFAGAVPQTVAAPIVSSVSLPAAFSFNQVFAAGSELLLTGYQYASPSSLVETCYEAQVALSPLSVGRVRLTNCDNPELNGASVAPYVSTFKPDYGELRIARLVSPAGEVELGPVLSRFQYDSGSHVEWTYEKGSLWLYEGGSLHQGPRVFRVSATTGQLLQSTPVPYLVRPLITADVDGLYVAGAGSFGGSGRTLIYRVAAGAKAAEVVFTVDDAEDYFVSWTTSDGDNLWANICHRPVGRVCEIWRFHGPRLAPFFHVSDKGGTAGWVLGDEATGLYSAVWAAKTLAPGATTTNWQVIRIDPRSGQISEVTRLSLPAFWEGPVDTGNIDAVLYEGCLYMLVAGTGGAGGDLYRVRL